MEKKKNESDKKNEDYTSLEDKKYQIPDIKGDISKNITPEQEKEMQKTKEEIDSLKKYILTTHKGILSIGIIPPQAAPIFDDENELTPEERKEKPIHIVVILEDDKEKEFNKIREDIIKKIREDKKRIWLNLLLKKDLWEICLDSKYEIIEAIGMSYPLYDKAGLLDALRVAEIHKNLVLKKFERYVYSYVLGGSLVRGDAIKTSDVDVYIIIDDTDVKRMPRVELKEKLRNIIYSYIIQASELAGVKNKLNAQVYLLTEFWEGVKDANPIFYTFLRDGYPLYDRGGFLPWKLLLKMGKIKPTPESIDMFMSYGDKTSEIVKKRLLDIVIGDIYWGIITPTQAILMLYGLPPTAVKETVSEFKRIFVEKEKLIEKKYADILEEIVIKYYKGFEHQKINEVSGKEVDRLLKNFEEYIKRLKELRGELEKRIQKKNFEEIYENVFSILKSIFGEKSETELIRDFEGELVNKGKINPKYLHTLKELVSIKKDYKEKKIPGIYEFEKLRKDSFYLIENLIEYNQRKELGILEKTKVIITAKGKNYDLYLTKPPFLIHENKIFKITDKVEESNLNEFNKVLAEHKTHNKIENHMIDILRAYLGDFDLHF